MTDENARFVLSFVFNVPVAVLAAFYAIVKFWTYRQQRTTATLRASLIAFALLASVLAYWTLGLALVRTDYVLPGPNRIVLFALRVVVLSTLVIAVRSWWRDERG